MKRNKFSEAQIIKIIKEAEAGRSVSDLCREHSIHESTFYNWKKKYGGLGVTELRRLKQLEEENQQDLPIRCAPEALPHVGACA